MGKQKPASGLGVDSQGGPVVDPTANVIALTEAANKRQDDLRAMEGSWLQKEMALRDEHQREMRETRSHHEREMRVAESARLDAIRTIDVNAVQRAAEVQAAAAAALATTLTATAEANRVAVAQVQVATTETFTRVVAPLSEAIADLRRVQYEQQGSKSAGVETKSSTAQTWMVAGVVGAIAFGLMNTLLAVGALVYAVTR